MYNLYIFKQQQLLQRNQSSNLNKKIIIFILIASTDNEQY